MSTPIETEEEALRRPEVTAIYDRMSGGIAMKDGCAALLRHATRGVTLGAYEKRILFRWLAQWEPSTVYTITRAMEGIREAAFKAGQAAAETGEEDDGR